MAISSWMNELNSCVSRSAGTSEIPRDPIGLRGRIAISQSPDDVLPRPPAEVVLEIEIECLSTLAELIIALVGIVGELEAGVRVRGPGVVPDTLEKAT